MTQASQTNGTEYKSPLALAVEQRGRKFYPFDVSGFLGAGDKTIGTISIQIAVKQEEDDAIVAAHAYAEQRAKGGSAPSAQSDRDLLGDAKTIAILFRICRKHLEEKYPAFPGPEWMRQHLTTDQLNVLLNCYMEARTKHGPMPPGLDDAAVEKLLELAADAAKSETELPEAVLAHCNREFLSALAVAGAVKLRAARAALAAALDAPAASASQDTQ